MYLHLNPHPFSILPSHPALLDETNTTSSTPSTPSRPQLRSFLHACLTESQVLLSSVPTTFRRHRKPRGAPPSTAAVHLYTRTDNGSGDYWVCRQSTHQDAAVTGSASWDEFRSGLRDNHSENEMDYTPSVTSVVKLLEWPSEVDVEGGWEKVDAHG